MALTGLIWADVPLRNYSLSHSSLSVLISAPVTALSFDIEDYSPPLLTPSQSRSYYGQVNLLRARCTVQTYHRPAASLARTTGRWISSERGAGCIHTTTHQPVSLVLRAWKSGRRRGSSVWLGSSGDVRGGRTAHDALRRRGRISTSGDATDGRRGGRDKALRSLTLRDAQPSFACTII